MSKAQAASTSSHKSSFSAAALVTTKDTLTFRLHPKQLVAFRSKATEIPYRGAAGGGKPHLMRPPRAGCYPSTWLAMCYPVLAGGTLRGRPTPRFRTIQVCPKDLRTAPLQAARAENRAYGPVGGADS